MKRIAHIVIVSGLICSSVLIFSCSDSEHRLPYIGKNMAMVTIKLGLPGEQTSVSSSLIDRMLRIITRDAMAQTAPAAFSSYTVNVTAAGMIPIQQSFTSSAITLTVPAGTARTFEVIAYVSAGDPSAALSFRGTTTLDLIAGQTVNAPVAMSLNETKIVVPDPFPQGKPSRIVQINDMTGAGWIAKSGSQIGYTGGDSNFYPYDVDFDSRGRIYIANNRSSTPYDVVIRIDTMSSTTCTTLGTGGGSGIRAIGIDRARNIVYYANSLNGTTSLRKYDLTTSTNTVITTPSAINSITGIDVASDGILYLVGTNVSGYPSIFRYEPTSNTVTNSYYNMSYFMGANDPKVMPPYVYVTNTSLTGYMIFRFDLADLGNQVNYGTLYTSGITTTQGYFYGPRRFVGIRNDALIIIDEDGSNHDKLVSMTDITGSNWACFGTYGTGINQFRFYSC